MGNRESWGVCRGVSKFLELGALLYDLLAKLLHLLDGCRALAGSRTRESTNVVHDLLSLTATDIVCGGEQPDDDVIDFVPGHRGS